MNTALAFVAGGLAGSFLGAAGKSGWDALHKRAGERLADRKDRRARAAEAEQRSAEAAAAVEAERGEREHLTATRVGVQFRRRYTADDPGTVLTVVSLGDRDWRHDVVVEEAAPTGRPPTEQDSFPSRVSIAWRSLVEPEVDQRHRTARLHERAFDDSVGWIQFERMG